MRTDDLHWRKSRRSEPNGTCVEVATCSTPASGAPPVEPGCDAP